MAKTTLSRRAALSGFPGALALAAALPSRAGMREDSTPRQDDALSPGDVETIRQYYAAWERDDWIPIGRRLTENFTFTSAAGDDHIDKHTFRDQCWAHQHGFIERFDLRHIVGRGNEAFVMYVCWTKSGKTLRNVEYLRLRDDKIEAIECYFGAASSYPSAVSSGQG